MAPPIGTDRSGEEDLRLARVRHRASENTGESACDSATSPAKTVSRPPLRRANSMSEGVRPPVPQIEKPVVVASDRAVDAQLILLQQRKQSAGSVKGHAISENAVRSSTRMHSPITFEGHMAPGAPPSLAPPQTYQEIQPRSSSTARARHQYSPYDLEEDADSGSSYSPEQDNISPPQFREPLARRPYEDMAIRVVVRKRPISKCKCESG